MLRGLILKLMFVKRNSSEIHEDFNRTRNGKYIDSKILFNNNSSIVSNTKEVSMLENIKVSQAIESDEYIEVTPKSLRMRKKILDSQLRYKSKKNNK